MKKKIIISLALICILVLTLTACVTPKIDKEIIVNGDFENYLDSSMQSWTKYEKKQTNADMLISYPVFDSDTSQTNVRNRYLSVEITSGYSTLYLTQKVKLQSGKKYKINLDMRIDTSIKGELNKKEYYGAYVGFLEDLNYRDLVINKATDGWVNREVYFTAKSSDTMTFVVGIGSDKFGGGQGKVLFDNISLTRVKEIPFGATSGIVTSATKLSTQSISGIIYTVIFTILSVALLYSAYYFIRKILNKTTISGELEMSEKTHKNLFTRPIMFFLYAMLSAFFIRFILFLIFDGMIDKLSVLGKIAVSIRDDGVVKFFADSTSTQPFGILYLLGLIGSVANVADLAYNSVGMLMLIRIPYIIADMVTCYLIFTMVNKHYNYKIAACIAGIFALLPMMFTASVMWGMSISIALAFVVGMVYCMIEKKHIGVGILYALSLLFSYYMIILLPLILLYAIYYIVIDKKSRLPIIITAVSCLIAMYLITLPFAYEYVAKGKIFFAFQKMSAEFNANISISNSVFNFFSIVGLANTTATTFTKVIVSLLMIGFIVGGVFMFLKSRNRLDFILLAALSMLAYAVFGIGTNFDMIIVGLILLLIYAGIRGEKRVFHSFAILSTLMFVNISVILLGSGYIAPQVAEEAGYVMINRLDPLMIIGSLLTTFTTIYLFKVAYDLMVKENERSILPLTTSLKSEFKVSYNSIKNKLLTKFQK